MTDKELRRLSRADLIEVIYEMQRNEKELQDENAALRRQLEKRQITISEAGSLAEVLAKLSGLFAAAQATADGYIEEAQKIRLRANDYLSDAKRQADQMTGHLQEERRRVLSQTAEECRRLWTLAERGENIPEFPELPESAIEGQGDD